MIRAIRRALRWTCEICGAVNPDSTGTCIRTAEAAAHQ
jgi:hypothetical protein